jgi:hypothetical protein
LNRDVSGDTIGRLIGQGHNSGTCLREMHTCEMHACNMHACEMQVCEMQTCEMQVCEVHACEVHACEVHACEMHAIGHAYQNYNCEIQTWKRFMSISWARISWACLFGGHASQKPASYMGVYFTGRAS